MPKLRMMRLRAQTTTSAAVAMSRRMGSRRCRHREVESGAGSMSTPVLVGWETGSPRQGATPPRVLTRTRMSHSI